MNRLFKETIDWGQSLCVSSDGDVSEWCPTGGWPLLYWLAAGTGDPSHRQTTTHTYRLRFCSVLRPWADEIRERRNKFFPPIQFDYHRTLSSISFIDMWSVTRPHRWVVRPPWLEHQLEFRFGMVIRNQWFLRPPSLSMIRLVFNFGFVVLKIASYARSIIRWLNN